MDGQEDGEEGVMRQVLKERYDTRWIPLSHLAPQEQEQDHQIKKKGRGNGH